jgi:hypothetical protein
MAIIEENNFVLGHKCRTSDGAKMGPEEYQWLEPCDATIYAAGCVDSAAGFQDFVLLKVYDGKPMMDAFLGSVAIPVDIGHPQPLRWPQNIRTSITLVRNASGSGGGSVHAGSLEVDLSYLVRDPTAEELTVAAVSTPFAGAGAGAGAVFAAAGHGGAGGGGDSGAGICTFFQMPGGCQKGAQCAQQHVIVGQPEYEQRAVRKRRVDLRVVIYYIYPFSFVPAYPGTETTTSSPLPPPPRRTDTDSHTNNRLARQTGKCSN